MEYVCGEVLFPGLQNFLLKGDLRYYPAKEKWLQLIENTTIFIAAPPPGLVADYPVSPRTLSSL